MLQESVSLASEGRPEEAVAKLVAEVKNAVRAKDRAGIVPLARNAALIYTRAGKLLDAAKYFEIALRASRSDPTLHLAIADVYEQLGEQAKAARHLRTAHSLAVRTNDVDVLEILDARGDRPRARGSAEPPADSGLID